MADKFLSDGSVKAGSTSVSTFFTLKDTTTGAATTGKVAADMTGSYWRQAGVRVAITLANLAAVNSAYSSGGVKEVDATNMPGVYRLDLPDAAVGTGADWVVASIKVAGCEAANVTLGLPTYASVADAFGDLVAETEGNFTVQQILSVALAALAGQTTTGGTVLKSPNGVATRIALTINGSKERTASTVTPSS
jgi:VCBS repeat-containing protein